jgi:hypothetical protein
MWLRGLSEIMVANPVLAARQFVIARSVSDEAIQSGDPDWIASRPPQDDGLQVNTFILAARLSARAMPNHSL